MSFTGKYFVPRKKTITKLVKINDQDDCHDLTFHVVGNLLQMFYFLLDRINDDWYLDTYEWKTIYLSNTVRLSLFIGRLSDLFSLLDTRSLPVLDHLSVTFFIKKKSNVQNDTQKTNITSRLRSLKIIYMSFEDLLTFLSLVYMPLLEKLTLIEIHDNSKCLNSFYCTTYVL
jgi:hypothetical protein